MGLSEENCSPPSPLPVASEERNGSPALPLSVGEAVRLSKEVPAWSLKEGSIERDFKFKGFKEAMAFVNTVAGVADSQDHHPDILISYNRVRLTLTTHKTGGLTRNDFILASRIDRLQG